LALEFGDGAQDLQGEDSLRVDVSIDRVAQQLKSGTAGLQLLDHFQKSSLAREQS
jgi:hypothetical protein